MIYKRIIFIAIALIFVFSCLYAEETKPQAPAADQQIDDFSLSGYGEKGKKAWQISGKTADIFTDVVKLTEVEGNLYGKEEDIKLVAKTGDFNKTDGKVHLEKDVVVTTSSGVQMNTQTLDWDRKAQLVSTKDPISIQRDNMVLSGTGIKGEPNLKKVAVEKDVQLDINPSEAEAKSPVKEKITITCDGQLEIDYEKSIATFSKNVKVERSDSTIYSDRMDVYFFSNAKKKSAESEQPGGKPFMGSKIDKIVARGNVKVVRGENVSYSQEAIYSASDQKLTLTGRPKLVVYTSEGF